jgi:hypothetical protein
MVTRPAAQHHRRIRPHRAVTTEGVDMRATTLKRTIATALSGAPVAAIPRTHPIKTTLALALTLGAIAPTAASAKYELNSGPAPPPAPTPQDITAPAGTGFDWGDAGIGAAGGVGLAALTAGGGGLVLVARRRQRRSTPAR